MFKLLGILLLCAQLIAGSLETEELKRKCLKDEQFKDDVKICSIKNNVAIFEKVERSMTFRCISMMLENQTSDSSNLTIKLSQPYEVDYVSNTMMFNL